MSAVDKARLTEAGPDHLDLLVTMMREFYAEAGYSLDPSRARHSFAELQSQPLMGRVFIVYEDTQIAGYLVLTLTFSMEYGGLSGFLDDLYLRPAFRGKRVGTAALARLVELVRSYNVRALHLEVGRDNTAAQSLYRRAGFLDNDRQLLTLQLAPASHQDEGYNVSPAWLGEHT